MVVGVVSRPDPYVLQRSYQGVGPVDVHNFTTGLRRVLLSSIVGTLVIGAVFGDSVPANSTPTVYTVTQANNFTLSITDGAIYPTTDPAIGASNGFVAPYRSSACAKLGDDIIGGGWKQNSLGLWHPLGSSTIGNWAALGAVPGGDGALNRNIGVAARRFSDLGITPAYVIWHGGPNDTNLGTSQANYAAGLASFIATCRFYWPLVKILIGICTQAGGSQSSAIQAAQAAAVDNPNGIYAGVNSDAFASDRFQDLTHLSALGRNDLSAGWVTQLHAAGVF